VGLLWEISHCPNIGLCLADGQEKHPCFHVVRSQNRELDRFMLPEPWSGDLKRAPILFLGRGPLFDPDEESPHWSWPRPLVEAFFTQRFGGADSFWSRDSLYPLRADAVYSDEYVRFWASVRKRAEEILGRRVSPGQDYALSSVVHCKATDNEGIEDAAVRCSWLYLQRIVGTSGAKVVITLGRFAGDRVRKRFRLPEESAVCGPRRVGGRERYFVFLPHPDARAPRTVSARLSEDQMATLRKSLGEE
jgi:hypothetical protein